MNLVLLGAPGAGKGTQAQYLVKDRKLAHISTGDLLREAVAAGTDLGKEAKKFMDAGQLVPDEVVIGLVKERLQKPDVEAGFILDGFPRNTAQATTFDSELEELGKTIDAALLVDVPADVIIERLSGRRVCPKCGYTGSVKDGERCPLCGAVLIQRDDDKPETIKARLDVYDAQTAPLIEYYRGQEKLCKVEGNRAPEVVYEEVKEVLA